MSKYKSIEMNINPEIVSLFKDQLSFQVVILFTRTLTSASSFIQLSNLKIEESLKKFNFIFETEIEDKVRDERSKQLEYNLEKYNY